jgi:hypothetical protein
VAEVPNFGTAVSGLTTNASTSVWVDYVTYTFAAVDQVAGAEYAVFFSGIASGNSTTSDYKYRVIEASTTKFDLNVEPKETASPQDLDSHAGWFPFTAAGTPVDTTFKIQILAEGGTAQMTEGRIRIVKLPTGSVWVESAAEQSFTTTSFVDKTSSSISLSGPKDYLFFLSAEFLSDAAAEGIEVGINVDGSVQTHAVVGSGVSDASNVTSIFKPLKISGTSTAKVQAKQTSGSANAVKLRNVRLLAIPASAFRASYYAARTSLSSSTSATYVDALTLTETVQAGQHLVFANFNAKGQSTSISTYAQLLSNGVATCETIRESNSGAGNFVGSPTSSVERRENLSAGSNTWKIQQKSETTSATSNVFAGASILVIDLEAGANAYALTASGGTFTETGTAAGLKAARNVSALSGSFALTGTAAGLKKGFVLPSASGGITLSGSAAGLKADRKLGFGSGAYSLTGSDAGLIYYQGGEYDLSADAGVFTIIGTSAGLKYGRRLPVDPGSIALNGSVATLARGLKLSSVSGSYSLTGSAATLRRTRSMLAESASYLVSGTSVDFLVPFRRVALGGSSSTGRRGGNDLRSYRSSSSRASRSGSGRAHSASRG